MGQGSIRITYSIEVLVREDSNHLVDNSEKRNRDFKVFIPTKSRI